MDYKGLEKTFNVKIPVAKHADYYIETLKKSPQFKDIDTHIESFKKYEESLNGESVKNDKYRVISDIVSHLHSMDYINKLRDWVTPEPDLKFEKISFTPDENGLYLSVDINEANWTVSNYLLGLDNPKWYMFLTSLNVHHTLASSKTFRQYVLGNTIPKRFASMMKYITAKHISILPTKFRNDIVMVSEDEIIFKVKDVDNINKILNQNWLVPVKGKIFRSNFHDNLNDHVRIDTIYNTFENELIDKYKQLKNINGNRFFIHFKTLILNEEVEDRDLLFMNDKREAKWVL